MTQATCRGRAPVEDAHPWTTRIWENEAEEAHTVSPVHACVAKITSPEVAEETTKCTGYVEAQVLREAASGLRPVASQRAKPDGLA